MRAAHLFSHGVPVPSALPALSPSHLIALSRDPLPIPHLSRSNKRCTKNLDSRTSSFLSPLDNVLARDRIQLSSREPKSLQNQPRIILQLRTIKFFDDFGQ